MKRIYFFLGKGGVGKSTLSISLAHYLWKKGEKVYLASIDPAHNLYDILNLPPFKGEKEVKPYFWIEEVDIDAYLKRILFEIEEKMRHLYAYLQIINLEKIFDLGPNWRAEKSHTRRHICEFRSCAVEWAFMENELEVERLQEELVVYSIKKVIEEREKELSLLGVELEIPKTPFPELRFPEVYDILEEMGKHIEFGEIYDTESEKILWKYVKEKMKSDFFFVNRFPFDHKPFYVMKAEQCEREGRKIWLARSVDLIHKGVELSSGGQREHRYEHLMRNIMEKAEKEGLNPKNLEWFTRVFKYGVPPHGGFAIGIERLTMTLLNLNNIREATLFPRDPERVLP